MLLARWSAVNVIVRCTAVCTVLLDSYRGGEGMVGDEGAHLRPFAS
jgi:hypothetical protein